MITILITFVTLAFLVRMDEHNHKIKQIKDANSNSNR